MDRTRKCPKPVGLPPQLAIVYQWSQDVEELESRVSAIHEYSGYKQPRRLADDSLFVEIVVLDYIAWVRNGGDKRRQVRQGRVCCSGSRGLSSISVRLSDFRSCDFWEASSLVGKQKPNQLCHAGTFVSMELSLDREWFHSCNVFWELFWAQFWV